MLLCRDQTANGKRTVHVVTACGIFVQHILDAAPIDKYFEMFKPGSGSEGGFVRLKMRLLSGPDAKKTKGTYTGSAWHQAHAVYGVLPWRSCNGIIALFCAQSSLSQPQTHDYMCSLLLLIEVEYFP